jgi:dTMP kinase
LDQSKKGFLLVIEGLDGSGKATQTALLAQRLLECGAPARTVTFPCYDQPFSAPARMYLNGELGSDPNAVNPYAAACFYAVDRFASFTVDWKSDYEQGKLLIADRYATSNAVYQMNKLPHDEWESYLCWLEDFEYKKLAIPRPDLVLYLDMPVEVSQRLMHRRYNGDHEKKDIHERNVAFLESCRESALFAAEKLNWKVISCSENGEPRAVEEVRAELWNAAALLNEKQESIIYK